MIDTTTTTTGGWYVAHMCPRCRGNHHLKECPQVRAIEYHEDGIRIKRVEFLTPGDYMPPIRRERGPFDPPYDITISTPFTAPYDPNKARAWYEATKTYTY